MSYEYGSESKLLELPNPYQLQNRLLWLCGAVLLVGRRRQPALGEARWRRARCASPARRSSPASCCSSPAWPASPRRRVGCASSSDAAGRRRSPPRSRPARPAARRRPTRSRRSCARAASPTPSRRVPVEGLLYHWAPTLITAPREVQVLARRYMFNLAAIAATLHQLRVLVGRLRQRSDAALDRHPLFRVRRVFLLRPVLTQHQRAPDDRVAASACRRRDPRPGGDRPGRAHAADARRVLAEPRPS